MAIKAGQILHDANGFVIDRIQSAGVGNVNIPLERIYELGNYQTVATIRDIPDLSFELESLDVVPEIEAILVGEDPSAAVDGDEYDFGSYAPLDILSPFKSGNGNFDIVRGVALPYLTLEQVTYRFGVRQNATQSFTLRGDSIYYIPGTPKWEEFTLVNNTLTYNFANTAIQYTESGDTLYALAACVKNPTTGTFKRLFFGTNYTNTNTSITLLEDYFDSGYTKLHVVYGTTTAATYNQSVHEDTSIKPAAVRGKDIDIYVRDNSLATPALVRWNGVQSFEVSRRVNLENDEEFGNTHYVASDYDTAEVSGSITLKPEDPDDLWEKIAQVANVSESVIAGPYSSVALPLEARISDPDTGDVLKTIYIPDARFTPPGVQGRVQQKLQVTFNFESDGGTMLVYKGDRP
jgi:hypothetical protein